MAKFTDFYSDPEVKGIMERFLEHFPAMFEGFNVDGLYVVFTRKKKSRRSIRLKTVGYPYSVYIDRPYIVEVFEEKWAKMNAAQKNLAVFHIMCAIPQGGFDEQSTHYGKKIRPDIEMYLQEFAAAGGVPNWQDNPAVKDPFELKPADVSAVLGTLEVDDDDEATEGTEPDDDEGPIPDEQVTRVPVTAAVIAKVGANASVQ